MGRGRLRTRLRRCLNISRITLCAGNRLTLRGTVTTLGLPRNNRIVAAPFAFTSAARTVIHGKLIPIFYSVGSGSCAVSIAGVRDLVASHAMTVIPMRMCNGIYSIRRVSQVSGGCNLGIVCSTTRTFTMGCGKMSSTYFNSTSVFDFRTAGIFGAVRNNTIYFGSSN